MNTFKIGDKVRVREDVYGILARAGFKLNTTYTVAGIDGIGIDGIGGGSVYLKETRGCLHYTHLKLYKEANEDVMTQQTQQKTKRVPFTHELWEKYKDKDVVVTTLNGRVLEQFTCFNLRDVRVYAGVYTEVAPLVGNYYSHHLFLEIPITSKRIPFNPELKDAKVFTTDSNQPVADWVMFKDGQVACQWPSNYMGYYPINLLEMEIEE